MPAIYAHNRFGEMVAKRCTGNVKTLIIKHYPQFQVGLQGPDIFFFYRPFLKCAVNRYGYDLHEVPARIFFERAVLRLRSEFQQEGCQEKCKKPKSDRNAAGTDVRQEYEAAYAYLLGFLCHFALDSECHPYVSEMMEALGITHMEIEAEFEKYLMRMDGKDALAFPIAALISADKETAQAVSDCHKGIRAGAARESLLWMKTIKRILTVPKAWVQDIIAAGFNLFGLQKELNGLMYRYKDNPLCNPSNTGLFRRLEGAVDVAVSLIDNLEDYMQNKAELSERFDRNFE